MLLLFHCGHVTQWFFDFLILFDHSQESCLMIFGQQESPFFITADDVNEVIRAFFMLKAQAAKAKDALQGEKAMK